MKMLSARKMYRFPYTQDGLLDTKARHDVKEWMQAIFLPISRLPAIIFLALALTGSFLPVQGQLKDPNLAIETILSGIETPVAMAFLGPDDMLVIEKNTGMVQRIQNGVIAEEPLLDVSVASQVERGLLGIAVSKNLSEYKTYVFLYYTEAISETVEVEEEGIEEEEDNNGDGEESNGDNGEPVGNRLYRYELSEDGNRLINPKMLLDLPYEPGPAHNGGTIAIGGPSDNNVCVVIGNLEIPPLNKGTGDNLAQNIRDGEEPDGRAGIICVTQDGLKINYNNQTQAGTGGGRGILGDKYPLDMYYAYGIRNSFGMDFDPVTGNLWDTENGGYDEINLVEPGFNSGFSVITGSSQNSLNEDKFDERNLVDYDGKGKYSDPELDLGQHVVPTAIVFYDSDVLGEEYENDMFVGTYTGKIFHFDLDENRTELVLAGKLADKMAGSQEELEDATFADDIGSITDLKVGPEGYLYATLFGHKNGDIVRIVPQEANSRAEE